MLRVDSTRINSSVSLPIVLVCTAAVEEEGAVVAVVVVVVAAWMCDVWAEVDGVACRKGAVRRNDGSAKLLLLLLLWLLLLWLLLLL